MSNLNLIQSKNGDYQQKRKNWKKIFISFIITLLGFLIGGNGQSNNVKLFYVVS